MTPADYFLARWAAVPGLPPLHLASNLAVDLNAMPDQWAGLMINAQEFRNLTMGSRPYLEETGSFLVGVFTRGGAGFAGTDVLARQVRDAFFNWTTADDVLRVESIDGPLDIDPAAEDGWHRLALEMRYQAWSRP